MIQRIQTLFLLIAAAFAILTFTFPFASFSSEGITLIEMNAFSITNINQENMLNISTNVFAIGTLSVIICALCLLDIMLFTNRTIQIRFTTYTLILIILHITVITIYAFLIASNHKLNFTPEFGIIAQIVSLILVILALKKIKKDEALVRSIDRIR